MSEKQDIAEIRNQLEYFIDENLTYAIASNPVQKDGIIKVKLRPMMIKGEPVFQAEEFCNNQAFHKNFKREDAVDYLLSLTDGQLKQVEVLSLKGTLNILVSKKGKMTVKSKKTAGEIKMEARPELLSHNRSKKYILEEGRAVPFLVDLGVMTQEGAIVKSRYDKFRQMNRFLEFVEDILPKLDKSRENTIIDFGCGKSYLTFAMYYYLKVLKEYPIRIIGLDLKKDVIARCNELSKAYGFDKLNFYYGDIASYEGVEQVDMVVTLHACDMATDYAIAKAVRWGAKVILSVPCCQHQLNGQMENELMASVFQYGLIKERMAALYTDALRALVLERLGYRTQILEFIDMEHTPKNILIRAVWQGKAKENADEIKRIIEFLNVRPEIVNLLPESVGECLSDFGKRS